MERTGEKHMFNPTQFATGGFGLSGYSTMVNDQVKQWGVYFNNSISIDEVVPWTVSAQCHLG
jgi:hypothetical protein